MDPDRMEEMRARHETAQNRASVALHAILRLIREMPEDDLEALGALIANIANSPPKVALTVAAYWQGIISAHLGTRFNLCPACGQNHEADLVELSGQKKEASGNQPALFEPGETIYTPIGSKEDLNADETQVMLKHNLGPVRGIEGELLEFVCVNCGYKYPTIQDRALKQPGPEGCAGCLHQARWG